jgi:hypothetical protein
MHPQVPAHGLPPNTQSAGQRYGSPESLSALVQSSSERSSVVLTTNYQIINGIINRLQVLNLVEFHKKMNPLKRIKVFKSYLRRKFEPLGKCPDASIDIRNLIFVTHIYYPNILFLAKEQNIRDNS